MTELREIVAHDDRVKFDELVYRRDMDTRIRDPREHDYRHSRVSFAYLRQRFYSLYIFYHLLYTTLFLFIHLIYRSIAKHFMRKINKYPAG